MTVPKNVRTLGIAVRYRRAEKIYCNIIDYGSFDFYGLFKLGKQHVMGSINDETSRHRKSYSELSLR